MNMVFDIKKNPVPIVIEKAVTDPNFTIRNGTFIFVWFPLMSIRVNPNYKKVELKIDLFSWVPLGRLAMFGIFLNNPDNTLLVGPDTADWQDYSPVSPIQYDFSRRNSNQINRNLNNLIVSGIDEAKSSDFSLKKIPIVLGEDTQGNPQELIFGGCGLENNVSYHLSAKVALSEWVAK